MSRFPSWLYRVGSEPDPRFSLANERTFLAWVRTALALLAGGVALEALEVPEEPGLRLAGAALLIVLGLVAAVQGWVGWLRAERALRRSEALPGPALGLVVASGVVGIAVLLAASALS